jgi:predicted outer membrane protein
MAAKSDFNADEWSTIVEGPVLAGMRVVSAGRGGTIRESLAIGKVYAEARRSQGENALLDQVVASPPAVDPQKLQGADDLSAAVSERLREALRLLEEKAAPEDVDAYKQFVLSVARAAAEAHKEGGFIGIGGRQISEEEQAALDELGELVR